MVSLRVDLRNGDVEVEAIRERLVEEGGTTVGRLADAPAGNVRKAVRDKYGLPPELGIETAERSLSATLGALVDGDEAAAETRLAEAFTSVCEREEPMGRKSDGRTVACHLYGPDESEDSSEKD
jgi:peptide/nickel transport system ATP-binding protein